MPYHLTPPDTTGSTPIDFFGLSPAIWKKRRYGYMKGARGCKAALTGPTSVLFRPRSPDDPVVKAAVGKWVAKARDCHAIALGRKPLHGRFLVIGDGKTTLVEQPYTGRAA